VTTLVIIPTYNERNNIAALAEALIAYDGVSVLVVDDNSPDRTGAVADELAQRHPGRVSVLHRTTDRGFGRSYIDGIRCGIQQPVDAIAQMDADFSHDPARLPALAAATANADVVIGSRYVRGGGIRNWSKRRRILSRFANIYVRSITGLQARDCTSGFRCWRREAIAALPLDRFVSDGYSFLVEMLFVAGQHGLRIAEVPITYVERREGESKMSQSVIFESAVTPWRLVATRGRVRSSRFMLW
jgi:dolichol-phosphate mannosyltransferase